MLIERTAQLCRKVMRRGGAFFADTGKREVSNVKRDINSTVSLDKYTRMWLLCTSVCAPELAR